MQILLDPAQYQQVEREATRSGRSVAAVIREAISARLARSDGARAEAAKRLLASADPDDAPPVDWQAEKRLFEQTLDDRLQ